MPISNAFDPMAQYERLPVERILLYQPSEDWTYSHHPHITFFNDRFVVMWSNGHKDEDMPGQRVLMTSSADFQTWQKPTPLADSQPGRCGEAVLTACGFHAHDGTLVAYIGQYEYKEVIVVDGQQRLYDHGHEGTRLRALTTTNGNEWSNWNETGLPVISNHGPQRTASGRLIISGNISYPYTNDSSGLSGWVMSGIYPPEIHGTVVDDSESIHAVQKLQGWEGMLCEGSFYQTDDRIIHMLLRSCTEWLWLTESRDDGITWSAPAKTSFSDNGSKFHLGRLPDNRFYYVGCPNPKNARTPLILSLSNDGVTFGRHFIIADEPYEIQCNGQFKGGEYGYPHTLVHNGYLYVVVSRQKEAIEVIRMPLDVI